MSTSSSALFKTVYLTLRLTEKDCFLLKSDYNKATIPQDFKKAIDSIVDSLGLTIIEEGTTEGIPVDLCYYWWEFTDTIIDQVTQRGEALLNFNNNIDIISGAWLLNQERFYSPISAEDKFPHPLIHIPYRNANSKEGLLNHFPRYAYIMDDSIWNYLLLWTNTQKLKENFLQIINQIRKNAFEDKYYYLNIAQEYAHLKARMLREAFIQNIGDKRNHGAYISPFLFHSESELEKIDTTEISEFKWRFLLVDDKIDSRIETGILSCSDPETKLTKATILKERINQMNIGSCDFILAKDTNYELPDTQECKIQIVCVENISEALQLMQKYEFDIILLDYLLQENYGYHLLIDVRDLYNKGQYTYGGDREKAEENKIIIGPQKKLFFMFISAFTTAVNERLTLEVLARDEDYWLIGEGACPTNTPELFKYRLTHSMKRRLDQTGISDLTEKKILNTIKEIFPSQTESEEEWIKSVRKRAYNNYHKILGYHYDYSILRENDRGKSVLVDSFLEKQVHLGAMLEHLLQMIHLIAFGTVRQWPEIWEEYKFFTRTINSERDTLPEISKSIEEYIIALKSA